MKCVICKMADTQEGKVTITLEKGELIVVFKDVPAQICVNCGEEYINEAITDELLNTLDKLAEAGTKVEIRQYIPA